MCRVLLVEHDRGKGKIGRGNRERTGCGGSRKVSVAQASDTLAQAEDRSLFGSCFCGTAVWSYCVVCESGLAQLTPLQRLCALLHALPPARTPLSTHPCLLQRMRSVDYLFRTLCRQGIRSLKVLPPPLCLVPSRSSLPPCVFQFGTRRLSFPEGPPSLSLLRCAGAYVPTFNQG